MVTQKWETWLVGVQGEYEVIKERLHHIPGRSTLQALLPCKMGAEMNHIPGRSTQALPSCKMGVEMKVRACSNLQGMPLAKEYIKKMHDDDHEMCTDVTLP